MAAISSALTVKPESGSPYQLNSEQVAKASTALLKHIKTTEEASSTSKPNLLAGADEDEDEDESAPIWLNLTTKKFITDAKRLKPSKLAIPHPLNLSNNTTICLITASPQRTYKDIVESPAFPAALRTRITRVVDLEHLRSKWSQYENQRKLFSEHDIFLADDRIILSLSKALGKTFYKTQKKRPIPVSLAPQAPKADEKKIKAEKLKKQDRAAAGNPGSAKEIATEIEKTLGCALITLNASTNTSVKVGYSSWDAQKVAENVEVVANGLIEKFVPKKWRGVKSLHIKGESTAALPIWLADEMWIEEGDIVEEATVVANTGKKRKLENDEENVKGENAKKEKKQKLPESNDDNLDREIRVRKEKLKKQKAEAAMDEEDEVPKPTKTKKIKAKAQAVKA